MPSPAIRPILENSPLFRGISLESVDYLLESCRRRPLGPGETLIDPETPNGHLYIVLTGELHVYLDGDRLPVHAVLGPGDCAGELSLIDGQVPSARVLAGTDTEVLAIGHDTLWGLVDTSHGIARNLLAILAGRVRHDNRALVSSQSRSLQFEQAASVDALTGLHNRRWMLDAFPRAVQRCQRDDQPLCLIMADIDFFKQVNDRYGHLAGDAVLRRVAGQMAASLRPQDLIVRYGGEEFAVLLPHTDAAEALEIAQRLRDAVATGDGDDLAVSVSCGVAPLRPDGNFDGLVAAADRALYRAKASGRNRVEAATGD